MNVEIKKVRAGWFVWRLSCLAAFVPVIASCSSEEAPEAPGAARPRVALVMKSLANEFFKTMEDGARAFHNDNSERFDLIVNGISNEEDVGGQITLIEQMIARGVDGLVVAPAASKALVPVLKRAIDAGIVVVNIDNKLDAGILADVGAAIPFVGPDNRKGARMAGAFLAARLNAGDRVAIIEGIPSAFNAIERRKGFEEAMTAAGIEIATSQAGNWEMGKANQVAAGIINEHPDLKAILCANDSMALGAVAALKDARKTGQVMVVGYDAISAVRGLIARGEMLCSIDQHSDRLAVFGIELALEMIQGSSAPSDRQTPVDLITAASGADAQAESRGEANPE